MLAVSANAAVEYTGSAVGAGNFYLYNVGTGKFLNGGDNTELWGTHAWLTPSGRYAVLTANGTGYNIDLGYSGSGGRYMRADGWCDQGATAWTFTPVEGQGNVYYINNGTTYLVGGADIADTRGATLTLGAKDAGNDANNQWKLVTREEIVASLSQATQSEGVDATSLIDCFAFDRNDTRKSSWTSTNVGRICLSGKGGTNIEQTKNHGCEAYNNNFSQYQTITGLPSGTYVLTVQGFGTVTPTYLYSGDSRVQIGSTNAGGTMDSELASMIVPDKYKNELRFTYIASDEGMKIGLERTEHGKKADWACWDNFSLTYYGVDLSEVQTALTDAVAAAEALYEKNLPTAAKDALKAVVDANNKSYTSEGEYTTAITNINAAKATATAILSAYDAYNAKKTVVVPLKTQEVYTDNSGAATALDAAIAKQDNVVNSATTAEAINTATAALVASANIFVSSVKLNDNAGFDMTNVAITNPEVWRSLEGWVNTMPITDVNAGAKVIEYWKKDGFNLYQAVPVAKGYYRLTVKGFHRINCSPIYAYAGDLATTTFKQELVGVASSDANNITGAGTWLDNEANGNNVLVFSTEAGNINIGVKNEFTTTGAGNGKDGWTVLRSFKLEYLGESPLSVLQAQNKEAKAAAQALLNNAEYKNVTGNERTTLANIINVECTTSDEYVANTTTINNAMLAFTSAVASYNAYVAMKTYPEKFNVSVNVATPNTAAEADDAVLLFKERTYDAVLAKYALDITDKTIGDFDTWTFTTTKQTANGEGLTRMKFSGEHYIDGTHTYYEGNQYTKVGWGYTMTKSVVLNPGEYVIKAAARAATTVNVTMTVNDGTSDIATKTLVHKGNTGYGIDTSGDCNFHSTGNYVNNNSGRGWEWEMIRFDLNEKKTVTITYSAETDAQYAWANICDASLLASQIDVPITINEGKTATTIGSEYALDFTDAEGIKAYTVSEINGSYAKMEQVTGAVPANTGLVITGTPGTYYAKVTQEAATLAGTNYLEAVTTETKYTSDASNTYYVYGALNGVEGFYKVGTYEVPAGKAVLTVPVNAHSNAKPVLFISGGATGITEVDAEANGDNEPIYNVCGQRISKAKGLVIKGSKKYFVK